MGQKYKILKGNAPVGKISGKVGVTGTPSFEPHRQPTARLYM